jgi:hypothetical protein
MTLEEKADNSHDLTRRTFIKAGSMLVGGAAALSGLRLETASMAYAKISDDRTLREGTSSEVGM